MSKKRFITGAIVLSVAGIFVKIMGFVFRIPLGRLIGAGGMGDYSPAYDVYAFVLVVATAGIPVAISKLVAEDCAVGRYAEAEKVFRTSQAIMATIGILGFLLLFFGADVVAAFFHMQTSALAIKAIAPTLLFAPVMSSYRGYFQGLQNMKPTAISQVVEQFFRVTCGLLAAYLLFYGLIFREPSGDVSLEKLQSKGAAGACFGATIGAICGLIAILIIYRRHAVAKNGTEYYQKNPAIEPFKSITKKIFIIAMPITTAACIMPLVNLADVTIVMRRLTQAGFEYTTAKAMFGELTGFAAPIIGLPQIVIQAIVVGLVPLIAEAKKKKASDSLQSSILLGYRTTTIIAMPCSIGLLILANPVMTLFYGDQVDNAVPCLQIYAVSFVFLSITNVTTAMLQGLGKQNIPLINLVLGLCVKVIVTYLLSGIVWINVKGAAIGTVAAYFVSATLDVLSLKKYQRMQIMLTGIVCKPLAASLAMGLLVFGIYHTLNVISGNTLLATLMSVVCGGAAYGIIVIKAGVITEKELQIMPFGKMLAKLLK